MHANERGHIDSGIPIVIVTILGVIVLSSVWSSLPDWVRIGGIVVLVALAVRGFAGLGEPSGMGALAERQRRADRKKDADSGDPGRE